MRDVYTKMLQGVRKKVLKSIVFHKIPIVEFDFTAISATACDGGVAKMSVGRLQVFTPICNEFYVDSEISN